MHSGSTRTHRLALLPYCFLGRHIEGGGRGLTSRDERGDREIRLREVGSPKGQQLHEPGWQVM